MNKPLLAFLLALLLGGCKHDHSTQQSPKWMPKQQPNNLTNQPSQKNTSLPIEVIRGKQFMDNKSLSIIANHAKNTLTFTVNIQLGDSIHLPKVYNSSFREYEDADHIELTVTTSTRSILEKTPFYLNSTLNTCPFSVSTPPKKFPSQHW